MSETHVQHAHQARSRDASRRNWSIVIIVMVATLALDQWSKWLIIDWLGSTSPVHRREFVTAVLAFEYVENTGAAFGIFAGRVWLLSVLAILVGGTFLLTFRSAIEHNRLLCLALGLILGGAAGNLIDRIRLGHVTDFIAVGAWPRFNIADSAITVGLVLITVSLSGEHRGSNETPGQPT